MARKGIDPARKKKPVSFTLSPEQRILCEWAAAQLDLSASEMIGKLIEKEAKRVARAKQRPLPDTNPKQITLSEITPPNQVSRYCPGSSPDCTPSCRWFEDGSCTQEIFCDLNHPVILGNCVNWEPSTEQEEAQG